MRSLLLLTILADMLLLTVACSHRRDHQTAQLTNDTPAVEAAASRTITRPTPFILKERQSPTAGRDLSKYNFGGRLGCTTPFIRDSPRCESSLTKARNFITNHWSRRTRAYVIVKLASVDAASNAHIFIEPDTNGNWHIVWRWEGIYAVSVPNFVAGEVSDDADIRSIDQRRADDSDIDLRPGTRYLVFLDASGNEVERL